MVRDVQGIVQRITKDRAELLRWSIRSAPLPSTVRHAAIGFDNSQAAPQIN